MVYPAKNNFPMDNEDDIKGKDRLLAYLLQDRFDQRYVLKDGAYKIIVAIVVGGTGLILSGVVIIAINFYLHAPK